MAISSNLKTALRARTTAPVRVLELAGAAYCDHDHWSDGGGAYRGKVLSWGELESAASDRAYSLELPIVEVELEDSDRSLAAIIASGVNTGPLAPGAAATIRVGHRTDVAYSDWYVPWAGIVAGYGKAAAGRLRLRLRPLDLALRRDLPHPDWTLVNDWPNAAGDVRQRRAPIRLGQHDNSARGGSGAVELWQVDTDTWVASSGVIEAVDRVFIDDLSQADGWTYSSVLRNGRAYSVVTFTTPPESGASVTADIRGLTDAGVGAGTLITDPVDQLQYLLVQFGLGSWQSGTWLSAGSYPIDATSFAAAKAFLAKLANGGPIGSWSIEQTQTSKALLDAWCQTWGLGAYWESGKVALAFEDHTEQAYATDFLQPEEAELGGVPLPEYDTEGLLDRISLQLPSGLAFDVHDPTARVGGVPASGEIAMPCARAYL